MTVMVVSIFIAVLVDNFSLTMEKMKFERKEKARVSYQVIILITITN